MYKLNNSEDAKRLLQGLGLHIDEAVVRQVVNVLSGKARQSLYSLYATRPDKPAPVCGKGSVYKIKKLYDKGELEPYSAYLSEGQTKDEQPKETEPEISNMVQGLSAGWWKEQVQFLFLYRLLDACLFQSRQEDCKDKAVESEYVKKLYSAGDACQFEALPKLIETFNIDLYEQLKDSNPKSAVWQARELFSQALSVYLEAFSSWLVTVTDATELFISSLAETATKPCTDVFYAVFNKPHSVDRDFRLCLWSRLFSLTVACDVLAVGIGQEQDIFWVPEKDGIRKFRRAVVRAGTKEVPEDDWQAISLWALTWAESHWHSHPEVKQKTEVLLEKRRTLENAQSDVLAKLKKLEVSLSR